MPTKTGAAKEQEASRLMDKLTAIDAFSGCGGMTYGLRAAGFHVLGAVEMDPRAASAYRFNHPTVQLIEKDISTLNPYEWMHDLDFQPGSLGLLAGCPPCQGFSRLRTRNGAHRNRDRKNRLLLEFVRIVEAMLPQAVMMENVPDLGNKRIFSTFLTRLRRAGYKPIWEVQDVQDYGVPQRRKRLVLLAGRERQLNFAPKAAKRRTVRDAIGHLDSPGNTGDPLHDMIENRSPSMKAWIERLPKDGGSRKDLPSNLQRTCHTRFNGFSDTYGRMWWDRVAPTITGGCFNPSKGRFLHPQENRNITMREAALLQSMPKSFRLPSPIHKEYAAQMIGNALPPLFVRKHALSIKRSLVTVNETDP